MADLTVQSYNPITGLTPSYVAAAAGGDAVPGYSGKQMVHIKNGGGAPITVTVPAQKTVSGYTLANQQYTINAGSDKLIGLLDSLYFADANGKLQLQYSAVTSVTVAAFNLP